MHESAAPSTAPLLYWEIDILFLASAAIRNFIAPTFTIYSISTRVLRVYKIEKQMMFVILDVVSSYIDVGLFN